jgi:hypothetical protein
MARDFLTNSNLKELMPQVSEKNAGEKCIGHKTDTGRPDTGADGHPKLFCIIGARGENPFLRCLRAYPICWPEEAWNRGFERKKAGSEPCGKWPPTGIVIIDPEGIVKSVNKSLLKNDGILRIRVPEQTHRGTAHGP